MKNTMNSLLAISAAVMLAACGSGNSTTEQTPPSNSPSNVTRAVNTSTAWANPAIFIPAGQTELRIAASNCTTQGAGGSNNPVAGTHTLVISSNGDLTIEKQTVAGGSVSSLLAINYSMTSDNSIKFSSTGNDLTASQAGGGNLELLGTTFAGQSGTLRFDDTFNPYTSCVTTVSDPLPTTLEPSASRALAQFLSILSTALSTEFVKNSSCYAVGGNVKIGLAPDGHLRYNSTDAPNARNCVANGTAAPNTNLAYSDALGNYRNYTETKSYVQPGGMVQPYTQRELNVTSGNDLSFEFFATTLAVN
jgi:hypothetical protein